jgi:hypothetical protein
VSQTPTKIQSFLQWSDSYIAIESQKDVIKSASILIDEIKEELLVITDANRNIATNP